MPSGIGPAGDETEMPNVPGRPAPCSTISPMPIGTLALPFGGYASQAGTGVGIGDGGGQLAPLCGACVGGEGAGERVDPLPPHAATIDAVAKSRVTNKKPCRIGLILAQIG